MSILSKLINYFKADKRIEFFPNNNGIEVFSGYRGNGRRNFCKIISRMPNVKIIRMPSFLSWFRDDIFCEFELDNVKFEIGEPFGDYISYWITTESSEGKPHLDAIRDFLIKYKQT